MPSTFPLRGERCELRPWTVFHLSRLEAFTIATNVRSCRTLEKAGFVLEGRPRRSFLKDGVAHDQCAYGWVAE